MAGCEADEAAAKVRCGWVNEDPLYIAYHDKEWGVPVHDDRKWFEMLVLEGVQAGLSWYTVLKRRENYREALDNFDPAAVAAYDQTKVAELLQDPGLIRNHLKMNAIVSNARAFLQVQAEFGSFDRYIWRFVDGKPLVNQWSTIGEVPARTDQSDALSKDLRRRGFSFVGSTICYALMQAAGLVNDHVAGCFRSGGQS